MKLFTIVIPTYNADNFVQETIESALNQDFKDYEIIIVDDNSTDKTPEILNKYKNIENIQIITHTSNQKAGGARNTGINNAKGKYILFLDADDKLNGKDTLKRLEKVVKKNDYPDVVYMGFEGLGKTHIPDMQSDVVNRLKNWEYPNVWDVLWKLEFIKKNEIYFEKNTYYEDFLFYYKAIVQSKSYGIAPFVTHIYRSDNTSMTRGMNIKKLKDYSYMITKALELAEKVDKNYEMALMEGINRNCYYFKKKLEEYMKQKGG